MSSFRFKRRSFLGAIGAGAVGLKSLLDNLAGAAEGMASPPRLFIMTWPVGTVRPDFEPSGAGTSYAASRLLRPFEDAGLREDMVALYGLSTESIDGPGGVGHQKGMVMMVTGHPTRYIRAGEFIDQDCCASGPSFDQIFLRRVPGLQTNRGYINAICDDRVDYDPETSTRCMSYSYATRPVDALQGTGVENIPLVPELSPLQLYASLFGSMMPGGGDATMVLRTLRGHKSVLDYSLRELDRIRQLAPSSEAPKIDLHAEAIRKIETRLSAEIDRGGVGTAGCIASAPPNVVGGRYDGGIHRDYDNPTATSSDEAIHEQVGDLHAGVIKAAFLCDLTRVATFQWSPGVNHIAFQGLYPGEPATIYQHHPVSHRIVTPDTLATGNRRPEVEFLTTVQEWYNRRTASILSDFKATVDAFGNNLLDTTVVPFVTEVSACGHEYYPLPALIFGGRLLGLQGGQYQFVNRRPHNDMWLTVAQAFGLSVDDLRNEAFMQDNSNFTGPIADLLG
jgi:hypothetical protein